MTARKATSSRKKQAPKKSVTKTKAKPKAHFPTAKELISIAAAIADPQEDEKGTARRALNLWRACHDVLTEEVAYFNLRERNRNKRQQFLSACGLTMDDTRPCAGRNEKTVPLDTFFKAINPDTRTLSAKWPLFWKHETEEVIPDLRGGELPYTPHPYRLPSDPDGEISAISIIPCWDRFTTFLKETVKETKAKIGATGPIWTKRYAAARRLHGTTGDPSKEAAAILINLTAAEWDKVRDHCEFNLIDLGKIEAAIKDAMKSKPARPTATKTSAKKS